MDANIPFPDDKHISIRILYVNYQTCKQILSGMQNAVYRSMKKGNRRIIAMAVWGDLIAPVFDSARIVFIATLEDGEISSTRTESLGPELPYSRASGLSEWGVEVLICGAISTDFARMLEMSGIEVIGFVSGNARQVLDAYRKGTLIRSVYAMPGCGAGPGRGAGAGPRRRRFRGGRG